MAGGALDAALALAEQARVAGPAAVREALAYLRELGDVEGETTRHAERRAGLAALRSGEALEGAMAFAQRRRPRWAVE
jgi:enoyl-CoA hydratase